MDTLSIKEAANLLKVSVITFRRYIKDGKIKAIKVGREYRIAKSDLNSDLMAKPALISEANSLVAKALEDRSELQYHVSRKEVFHQASDLFKKAGDIDMANRTNFDANIFGYAKTNIWNESESRKKWGRFAPMGTGKNEKGQEFYFPDPSWIDGQMLKHAEMRVAETKNPITLAAYYDLLFEYSPSSAKKGDFAKKAISNYSDAAKIQYENNWFFEFLDSIIRAFELSIKIKDKSATNKALKDIFNHLKKMQTDGNIRYSLEILEVLVQFPAILTTKQFEEVIIFARAGQKNFANNWLIERSFLAVIESGYKASKKQDQVLSVLKEKADSFIKEADAGAERGGLVEATFLESAFEIIKSIGSQEEKAELRRRIEKAYLRSQEEMKPISAEIKITGKQQQELLKDIFVEDKIESLDKIGKSRQLIPSYLHAEKMTKELFDKHPLQHLVSRSTIQDGRKIIASQGGSDITQDDVIEQIGKYTIPIYGIFLQFVFDEMKKRNIGRNEFIKYLKDKDFFQYPNFGAVAEGIEDYFEGKYYSCLSILLPQIEQILRLSIRKMGLPTMRIENNGEQRVIHIKEILETLHIFIGNNIFYYFSLITWDKRGFALRDSSAHGLLEYNSQNRNQAELVMHMLLVIAQLRFTANPNS